MARCKGYRRLRRLACSATAAAQQSPPHTSRLKAVHRTVFLTPLTLSGFESLENKKRTEAIPTVLLLFLARCKGYSRLRRLACSATAAAQQYPPHTSRLKTVRRTVFSTPLTLSGFESLTFWFVAKHSIQLSYQYIRYNQRIVIKNDVVYDMNCTICFASPYPQCTL